MRENLFILTAAAAALQHGRPSPPPAAVLFSPPSSPPFSLFPPPLPLPLSAPPPPPSLSLGSAAAATVHAQAAASASSVPRELRQRRWESNAAAVLMRRLCTPLRRTLAVRTARLSSIQPRRYPAAPETTQNSPETPRDISSLQSYVLSFSVFNWVVRFIVD